MSRLPSLSELKKIRKQLGWSQVQLAREAGVSRSLIDKMESGKRLLNYNSVSKIAECLTDELRKSVKPSLPIGQICSRDLVSIDIRQTIGEAREALSRRTFSHLPVFDGDRPVGTLTED